ncbi:protocadherin Fat 1-like [Trichomycterus rosablanca]|uniref:protocadherin Fat 1-like n=1 Tax=Trichomycterus rosablanca TaxID=2290929 RepID=UPI002F3505F5
MTHNIKRCKRTASLLLVFSLLWNISGEQIHYTIPEELKEGFVVGNIAKDLGFDVSHIAHRKLRIASESSRKYFRVDSEKGELVINDRIDRENICAQNANCLLPLQVVIENPLQLHRVEIEIQDINDNSPHFQTKDGVLKILESVASGARFPLESAEDLDVGSNSLNSYSLNKNNFFSLNVKTLKDGRKVPELIVDKPLDREKQSVHKLILTAYDGGNPVKSGTALIQMIIEDSNDNEPKFELALYKAYVHENAPVGSSVITIKATDLDEGLNSEIQYYFGAHTTDLVKRAFKVNQNTGEITVIENLDYEIIKSYTFDVCAKDKGNPALEGHSAVQIDIVDENDNPPEIILTSLPSPVPENATVGTVVALINVRDLDSGDNGKVKLNISSKFPFKLKPTFDNHYSLVTDRLLDREVESEYNVEIVAQDSGVPSLKTTKSVTVKVLDVNDNPPRFSQSSYIVYVKENSPAGEALFSVAAFDVDTDKNAILTYSILDLKVNHVPASSYFYINSENGTLYSMSSFDYENIKLLSVLVQAKDHGSPTLSSNATVHVFIMDQNDNVPSVIYPSALMGSVSHQRMPRSAKAGHLVTKVTAVDADSGHNAWISYWLAEATDSSLFTVNLHTGEVRTKRSVSDQDESSQRLIIGIKDNGEPVQSTTVTVDILIEDAFHEPISDYRKKNTEPDKKSGKITLYLIISVASVSLLCLATFFVLLVKCGRSSRSSSSCCIRRTDSGYKNPNNLQIQLNTDGPIKYVEVLGGDVMSQSQSFGSYLSPMSEFSDFTLVKPSSTTDFTNTLSVLDASLPDSTWKFESQQVSKPQTNYPVKKGGRLAIGYCSLFLRSNNKQDCTKRSTPSPYAGNRTTHKASLDVSINIIMTKIMWFRGWRRLLFWLFLFLLLWNNVQGQTRYSIPEEMNVGSVVGNIAKDLGLKISDLYDRKLQIASESGKQYFNVNLDKGEMVVNERIDRETLCGQNANCLLPVQIIIEDPLQLYRIDVEILDINDNSPHFQSTDRALKIAESTVPGTRFPLESAHDPDVGSNSLKSYTLSKDECFSLKVKELGDGRKVPELVLEKALDREKKAVHQLLLNALDGGNPVKSGTTQINITVLDINDNIPVFTKAVYKVSISENSSPGTSFLKVVATDPDEGTNGEIQYSFGEHTPDSVRSLFYIDPKTGEVHLNGQLDFETTPTYNIEIIAKDEGVPEMEGHCTVQIDILDINDNPPQIVLTSKPSPVREDAPSGTVVALISARDIDSGVNGKVSLHTKPNVPFILKPTFSNDYSLVTNGALDRETFPEYDVEITAVDSGSPSLSSKKFVSVKIFDVNDNSPKFTDYSYKAHIKENNNPGSIICTVSASDFDAGESAKISYSILDTKAKGMSMSSYFYINSDNGSIFSMHSFDYEKVKVFQIQVQARDHGSPSLSSNTTVHVFIVDQNDNVPSVIYPSALMGSVSHQRMPRSAKAGHLVTKVTAVDADSGHNAWISYWLAEATDSSLFTVNLHTGEVRTKRSVSDQDESSQRLIIGIKDNGEPVQSTTVTVDILIEDAFHEPISDYRKKNTEPDKKSGKITLYLIISVASVSLLCLATFFVLLVKCARSSRSSSSCCIRRTDSGYKNPNNLQIQLNTDGPIKYVEVLGGDMMSQSQSFGSYLSPMSEFSDFTLVKPSSTTDFTNTLSVLDASLPDSTWKFESQQIKIIMTKIMWFRGWRRLLFWLFLFLLLWNNVQGQTRYSIPEEMNVGSVVGNIAKDLGLKISDLYDRKLQIASESGKQYFNVNLDKGEMVVNERIDRETLCGQNANCLLPVQIIIEDPLQLYRIDVEILDMNDNSPHFQSTDQALNIAESTVPGTRFPLESAHDPDVGSNSLKSYTLSKDECFSLKVKELGDGRKVPELVLEKALDREKKAVHQLLLNALDGGNPVKSGTTQINITVLDINDNNPVFTKAVYKVSISENSSPGTSFLKVVATDPDEGTNGEIQYSFGKHTPDSVRSLFYIDPKTGEMHLNGQLDFETTPTYNVEIIAKDKGVPEMEGHCTVQIDILDINDNPPQIVLTSKPSPVREDAPSGTVVALISARDIDSGVNGKVSLHTKPNVPFILKPTFSNDYSLVTNGALDRETFPEYDVEITAVDSGSPSLSSKKFVSVKILDVNDNSPKFTDYSYKAHIKENNNPGSIICTVSASDFDAGESAKISYSILDSKAKGMSMSSYFYINSDNGSIFSMHSFDYEKVKVFQIQVQAKDHGSPSLSSNTTVHVFIVDQNDNVPSVIYPSALMGSVSHQRMPRSAKAGHLVTKVTAVDADSGHNAWISYWLAEATDSSLFTVQLHTGEVRTKRSVSDQDESSQRLIIGIKDNGEPVQSTTVTVDILIEDAFHEPISDYRKKNTEPDKKSGKITLYLIISVASVSLLCLATFFVLLVKCARSSRSSSSCCIRRTDSGYKNPNNLQIQLNTDGPIKYVEVLGGDVMSQSQSFGSYLSPMSEFSDFTLIKPSSTTDFTNTLSVLDASLPDSTWKFESQQAHNPPPASGQLSELKYHLHNGKLGRGTTSLMMGLDHIRMMKSPSVVIWIAVGMFFEVRALELLYSIAEESELGTVVGHMSKDLNIDVPVMMQRELQVISESNVKYFDLDSTSGALVMKQVVDRESICSASSSCHIRARILLQKPLEVHHVAVELVDINDNSPVFQTKNTSLEISEAAAPGTTFRLESARDLDVGVNSMHSYTLSPNDCFIVKVELKSDGSKLPILVLNKQLDREKQNAFRLTLTAVDGGKPERSGTTLLFVNILDINDNAPKFDKSVKRVTLLENSLLDTLVTIFNASDADYGLNGEILYSFDKYTSIHVLKLFRIDPITGEMTVTGKVDYEQTQLYDITVQARDRGSPAMEGSCNIKLEITDVNDNTPVITINYFTHELSEAVGPGTVFAILNIEDKDVGKNGEVNVQIPSGLPFRVISSYKGQYSVMTDGLLDRETVSEYTITVMASDSGSPTRSSQKSIVLHLSDANDNIPRFSQPSYSVEIAENNPPNAPILTVSAFDPDMGENATLSYFILDSNIGGSPITSYVYIHQEKGHIYAMRQLDYEQMNMLQFVVHVRDHGSPGLGSNVSVHVFILDQNDHSPMLLYPPLLPDETLHFLVPTSAGADHLVNRIFCMDKDNGYNAWLFYSLAGLDAALFHIGAHTGDLRTARKLTLEEQKNIFSFVVLVQDNGMPALSTSIAVNVTLVEKMTDIFLEKRSLPSKETNISGDLTFYLITSLSCIIAVCLLTIIVAAVLWLSKYGHLTCLMHQLGFKSALHQHQPKDFHLQLNTDGPIRYLEVVRGTEVHNTYTYEPCLSTVSSRSDFVFVKTPKGAMSTSLSRRLFDHSLLKQKPPNNDWRLPPNQRPGPSGAGVRPEDAVPGAIVGTGPWPNPPTEAEQLQALMAAANAANEATATLGPRYNAQYVPDYRQNVYIPGSTATLTANSQQQMPQQALPPPQAPPQGTPAVDIPKAAPTPASKKKVTKKEERKK